MQHRRNRNSIDEKPLRSSGPDFDRFIKSAIWYDMQNLIKDRIEILQKEFLGQKDIGDIRNIQGQMAAWHEILGIPSYLKATAHAEQSNNTEQSELDYEQE